MVDQRVGHTVRIEAVHIKATPPVLDDGLQTVVLDNQPDLDLLRRAAVADSVRAGLLNGSTTSLTAVSSSQWRAR